MRWRFTWLAFAGGLTLGAGSAGGQPPQPAACHGDASPYRLLIDVEGVRSDRGDMVADIYGSEKRRWLANKGWLFVWNDPAHRGTQTLCAYLPQAGSYAVVVYHDANSNGVLDQGLFGIPTEGYGFSNNVRPRFHAPSLASASFSVSEGDTHLHIRLRYP